MNIFKIKIKEFIFASGKMNTRKSTRLTARVRESDSEWTDISNEDSEDEYVPSTDEEGGDIF